MSLSAEIDIRFGRKREVMSQCDEFLWSCFLRLWWFADSLVLEGNALWYWPVAFRCPLVAGDKKDALQKLRCASFVLFLLVRGVVGCCLLFTLAQTGH